MRLRSAGFVLSAVVGLGATSAVALPVAQAAGGGALVCLGHHSVSFTPGISAVAGKSAFHTDGGEITCTGAVNGQAVTGPGTFAQDGIAEGDCSHGSAVATAHLTLPTSGGTVELTIPYRLNYAPGFGEKTADQMAAVFQFYPTQGDCISTPVTQIAVVQQTILRP